MIFPGDVVAHAFATIGWGWGGSWRHSKDYQHFVDRNLAPAVVPIRRGDAGHHLAPPPYTESR
jgi:hypothetical protein